MNYTADSIIRIAKRMSNPKRHYLVVNPLQGKHLPVHPKDALAMMHALGTKVREVYPKENVLCIGFAETATAIGAVVASHFSGNYIHTTREEAGRGYFSFAEEHSHATEQKLCADHWDQLIKGVERIVIVEDEISTGKTARALVSVLRKSAAVPENLPFSVAALTNLAQEEDERLFAEAGIETLFLVKADKSGFDARADGHAADESLLIDARVKRAASAAPLPAATAPADEDSLPFDIDGPVSGAPPLPVIPVLTSPPSAEIITSLGRLDPRIGVLTADYMAMCEMLGYELGDKLGLDQFQHGSLLVLGTEECMYPALSVAAFFETTYPNLSVYNQATARTSIVPSPDADSPITKGYQFRSVYDTSRATYLYNLGAYDRAILITDSNLASDELQTATEDVRAALSMAGTHSFLAVHWI